MMRMMGMMGMMKMIMISGDDCWNNILSTIRRKEEMTEVLLTFQFDPMECHDTIHS